ncbi:hypothetical protein E2C01_075264 [Portunus trituberculatus]|uniref:Uncharacterized protein n=1 Tax=Portunus trituberculatus TaxID=210409 RepID=A0A5B7IFQ7_PORTR|nr:hypothetical protein [Portunus trituberculatus]
MRSAGRTATLLPLGRAPLAAGRLATAQVFTVPARGTSPVVRTPVASSSQRRARAAAGHARLTTDAAGAGSEGQLARYHLAPGRQETGILVPSELLTTCLCPPVDISLLCAAFLLPSDPAPLRPVLPGLCLPTAAQAETFLLRGRSSMTFVLRMQALMRSAARTRMQKKK